MPALPKGLLPPPTNRFAIGHLPHLRRGRTKKRSHPTRPPSANSRGRWVSPTGESRRGHSSQGQSSQQPQQQDRQPTSHLPPPTNRFAIGHLPHLRRGRTKKEATPRVLPRRTAGGGGSRRQARAGGATPAKAKAVSNPSSRTDNPPATCPLRPIASRSATSPTSGEGGRKRVATPHALPRRSAGGGGSRRQARAGGGHPTQTNSQHQQDRRQAPAFSRGRTKRRPSEPN